MTSLRIKQLSNQGSTPNSSIVFDGMNNVWQKVRHMAEFTSADLVNGILTVQHDLERKYVQVTIYDEDDSQIIADQVKVFDNMVQVYLNSFTVTNWVVLVS